MHFILSDNDNYDFVLRLDVVNWWVFVKVVIDYEFLIYVFHFKIKEKEKDKFFIKFYSTIFLQNFFFANFLLFKLNNNSGYVCG